MPLAMIEIEQIEGSRWHAWVEAGFPVCKRENMTAADFEGIMAAVWESYSRLIPGAPVIPAAPIVAAAPSLPVPEAAPVRVGPGRPRRY